MPEYSRRSFLQGAGLTGLALALPFVWPAQSFAGPAPFFRETRLSMGTLVHIQLGTATAAQYDTFSAKDLLAGAFLRINELEDVLSRYRATSSLSVLNARQELENAPQPLLEVLHAAKIFEEESNGAFSLSVATLVDAYKTHSQDQEHIQRARQLAQAGAWQTTAQTASITRQGASLTLDGIAKGFVVDEVSRYLTLHGAPDHLIDAGGDILARGEKAPGTPWRVGVQNPARPHTALFTLPLKDQALATSGTYEQSYGEGKSHLIPPVSLTQNRQEPFLSASALAYSAMQADALATSISVLSPAEGSALIKREKSQSAILLGQNGKSYAVGKFPV